ncbi:MAG: nucleotidyltransferase family protein [Nanoarchaeota archaeon]|nr:nucleotidyltransferase family protein [Nanoarchaeota archaeon]
MDAIILAAGYAVRLYPLTENTPKPLLKVAGKPIVEHIINKLEELDIINKIYIVTNDKFEQNFIEWLHNFDAKKSIEIINDRTKSNDDRLGALGDVRYVIDTKKITDDIAVIAGDNIFEFSLNDVIDLFKKKESNIVVLHDVKNLELAKQYGVVEVKDSTVINFEEKPAQPKSTLISTGIYLFPKETLPLIKKYIDDGNSPDKTGSFIEWLHKRDKVYAYVTDKPWYDIGNIEQLEKANKHFKAQ